MCLLKLKEIHTGGVSEVEASNRTVIEAGDPNQPVAAAGVALDFLYAFS